MEAIKNNSPEYNEALEAARVATHLYKEAAVLYRSYAIGDDEFLKAKAIYAVAEAAFDVAYAKERQEEVNHASDCASWVSEPCDCVTGKAAL